MRAVVTRVAERTEAVVLIPHTGRHDRVMLQAFLASLRADDAPCATPRPRTAYSTAGAWQRALRVGCCPPCPVRCAVR